MQVQIPTAPPSVPSRSESGAAVNLGLRIGARLWWGLPVLLILLWVAGAFAVEVFPGLASTPLSTVLLLPLARFARDVAAAITVGALVIGALLGVNTYRQVFRWAFTWALLWLISLAALLALTISDIFAASVAAALQPGIWWSFLVDVSVGRVFLFQFIAVAIVAVLCTLIRSRAARWVTAVIAVSGAAAPAVLGHGGVHAAHVSAAVSLAVHIAAISIWVGGLAVLVALLVIEPSLSSFMLPRFSLLALWCVIFVAESGLLNSALHLGDPSQFVGSFYGVLVLTKVVLLGVLVRFGWLQRNQVLARISDGEQSRALLARYAAVEMAVMGAAIAISVVLSRIGLTPARTATGEFLPPATVLLAIAVPLLLVWVFAPPAPRSRLGRRSWALLTGFSPFSAVLLLVVVAEVAGVGIFGTLLGPELGVVVGTLLLLAAGYLWATSVVATGSVAGIVLVMVGWPPVMWLINVLATNPVGWKTTLLSVLVAEALLAMLWVRRPNRVDSVDVRAISVAG